MNTTFKSILNVTWKVGVGLFGLAAIGIGIIVAIVYHEERYGRDYYNDKNLSPDIKVEAYNNNRVRVWNRKTASYTTPKLVWVSGTPERDSLTVFCDVNGNRGYLNAYTGEIVIPAQYRRAWQFSEGLGAVLGENNHIGFIDKDNNLVIDCEIPYERGSDYVFKDGYLVVHHYENGDYVYAAYGKDGRLVLSWAYSFIGEPNEDGYRIVCDEDGYMLMDRDFKQVFPKRYDAISFASKNEGVYLTKNHVKQLVNYDGKVLEPFVVDGTYRLKYMTTFHADDADEYALVNDVVVYIVDSWEGLMDARTGKVLTPAKYWDMSMASKDLVRAQLGSDEECVILDLRGREVKQ